MTSSTAAIITVSSATTARRFGARLLAAALVAVLSLAAAGVGQAQAVGGATFVELTNVKRATVGKGPVSLHAAADKISIERADAMARTNVFAHDMAYVAKRLKELGVCYSSYGEIIYWTSGTFEYQRAIDAWWKSSGHNAIMQGDYHVAGGSWTKSSSGKSYAAMIFVKLCSGAAAPAPSTSVSRVAGSDRYATAAAVSKSSFGTGVPVAFIATGGNFPDALAGGAAAAKAGGPILLVSQSAIPQVTRDELARLKPNKIVVLGATPSVGNAVFEGLRKYATSGTVSRIAGSDRYATAAKISQAHFGSGVPVVYVATGAIFPDALGGGAGAGRVGGPVLLVTRDGIPSATAGELARLKPGKIVILGGSTTVGDGVAAKLKSYSASVSRLAGKDRFATSVAISKANFATGSGPTVFIATGMKFPDGLAAGPVAGRLPGPLLLVGQNVLPQTVTDELKRLKPKKVVVLGSSSTISDAVVAAIRKVLP